MAAGDSVRPPPASSPAVLIRKVRPGFVGATSFDDVYPFARGREEEISRLRLSQGAKDVPLYRLEKPRIRLRPWCMVCALDIEFPAGNLEGTGWLAGKRTVITAGHNLFSQRFGGWAKGVRVTPGQDGEDDDPPYGSYITSDITSVDGWVNRHDPNFDYGMIRLPTPVGAQTGFLGYGSFPDGELLGRRVNLAGYPSYPGLGEELYLQKNAIRYVSAGQLYYMGQTIEGQSGSPVFIQESPNAEPLVVAIHASGSGRTDPSLGFSAPAGVRISDGVRDTIDGWVGEE